MQGHSDPGCTTVLAGPADGRSAMSSLMILADGGYAPRFLAFFMVLSFFRFGGESTLPPPQLTHTVRCLVKEVELSSCCNPKELSMPNETLTHRLARRDDLEVLRALMDLAISELQKSFLDENQIASSRAIMGLDTQLIDDGTYFVVESDVQLAGCGGWSRRATMYGGDQTPGRSAALLDPTKDA